MDVNTLFNNIKDEALSAAQVMASDWIKQQVATSTQQSQPTVAPPPAGTLPADVVYVQESKSQFVFYGAIAAAIIGAAFLLFGRRGRK